MCYAGALFASGCKDIGGYSGLQRHRYACALCPLWPRARRNVSGQDFPVSLPFVIEWLVGRLTAVMDMCWTFEVLVLCVVLHLYTVCIPSDR